MNDAKLKDCFGQSLGIPVGQVTDGLAYNAIKSPPVLTRSSKGVVLGEREAPIRQAPGR
jgi:hypothetical protein